MASERNGGDDKEKSPNYVNKILDRLYRQKTLDRMPSFALFWIIWTACALTLTVPTIWWASRIRDATYALAKTDIQEASRSAAAFVDNTFGLIDVVLKRLSEVATEKPLSDSSIDELCPSLICSNNKRLSPFLLLGFTRNDGQLITFGSDTPTLNLVDRDYFIAQREADAGLYVGAPRFTPYLNGDGLPLSRRLTARSGAFDGIVAAVIHVTMIRAVFEGLGSGKADRISLIDAQKQRLASWSAGPADGPTAPCDTTGTPPRSAAFSARTDVGIAHLTVLVCRSKTEVMKPWWRQVALVALAEASALLLPILALPLIQQRARRRAQQEKGFQELVDGTSDFQFIVAVRPDGTFVLEALRFNREGEDGPAAASLVGRTVRQLFSAENAARIEADYRAVFAAGETRRIERRIVMEGTELIWSTLLVPLRDAGGRGGYIYGAATDMTQGRKLESRLMRFVEGSLRHEDNERRRIARELHDTTGQNLIAVGFELDKIAHETADLAPGLRDAVIRARARIDTCIAELRTLSYVLYPALLDEAGLGLALKTLAEGFERRSGVPVDVAVDDDLRGCRWAPEVELALYRVAQEALTNVQRHSAARQVHVWLHRKGPGNLELIIEDDVRADGSHGLVKAPITEGAGIRGMRDRLDSLNGKLVVSTSGSGVRVTATVPARMAVGDAEAL